MRLLDLSALALATIVAAAPAPWPQFRPPSGPEFYLRVVAPQKPWNHRPLVPLPSTQALGIENFTVHPATQPLYLSPVSLDSGAYALKLSYAGDDLSRSPYVAALLDSAAPAAVGLKTVYVPGPGLEGENGDVPGCPEDLECVTDAFSVVEGAVRKIAYAGFGGGWSVVKDASPEGWRVYWEADRGKDSETVEIEIVAKGG